MQQVLISLGSNHLQSVHIQWASERMGTMLADAVFSRRLWTPDIKGTGLWYMNRLVKGYTTLSAEELEKRLKQTETETGRTREQVTLDADLLQYGPEHYHLHDWQRPYVLELLPDVMDEKAHNLE